MDCVVEALEGRIAPMECFHETPEGKVSARTRRRRPRLRDEAAWTRVQGGVTKALAGTTLAERSSSPRPRRREPPASRSAAPPDPA